MMSNTLGHCASCYFEAGAYYRLSGTACVQCSQSGCASYSTSCVCLSCQEGYQFVNSQCIACQNLHCNTCQNNVRSCQVCAVRYGLTSSACIQCVQSACLNCDGDTTKCVTCETGYYNNAGTCYRCQASCTTCTAATVCSSCNNGYYLMANGRCKSMPSYCVQVDEKGECSKCGYGYMTMLGNCVPCSTSLFNVLYMSYLVKLMLKILPQLLFTTSIRILLSICFCICICIHYALTIMNYRFK